MAMRFFCLVPEWMILNGEGDIILLIYSQQPGFELSRKITRNFFKNGEEKIDVLVINPMNTGFMDIKT